MRLPGQFSLVPGQRPRHYLARQNGNDILRSGWRCLDRTMARQDYIRTKLHWQRNGWQATYTPAPERANVVRLAERPRRWLERLMHIQPGSPRSKAPRFDEDSLDKILRKIGALGFWIVILIVLIQTEANISDLPNIDQDAAHSPWVQFINQSVSIAQIPVAALMILIAADMALFVARRIYRLLGWDFVTTAIFIAAIIFLASYSLFGLLEVAKVLNDAIDAAR
ncbi:MAG: hypothetical protein Q4G22_04980 [Paracoccus sp. (in: a-proteobacteria)]|nr:hypothetical protein [Paracoccus sp. (in: a-proteobacteria)]